MAYEKRTGSLLFSSDKKRLNVKFIHNYLSKESYWSKNISLSLVKKSIKGSVCFGVYKNKKQIAFARMVTDEATFGYLADVFVIEDFRGKGISKQLMRFIMDYPKFRSLRSIMLATLDAHGLYEQFGFKRINAPGRYMNIKFFEEYKK